MAKNGNGKRPPAHSSDVYLNESQFDFSSFPKWRNMGKSQKVLGSELIKHEPITKIEPQPLQIEFELKDKDEIWSMGPNTYFEIKGQYQVRTPKTGDKEPTPWVPCEAADIALVTVAPNAPEILIRNVDMFHGNTKINSSDESRYLAGYLNTYLYANMHEKYKKRLCKEECHPGFGVPTQKGGWKQTVNSEWKKYGQKIFVGNQTLSWTWIPLHFSPLFQGCNYLEHDQKILPMPLLDKITIRILFHERLDSIFNIVDPKLKEYRFAFSEFNLHVEHLRLSHPAKQMIMSKKGQLEYPGVTRLMKSETIPAGNTTYKATIQKVPFPEGIFIFALPKEVLSGLYEYKTNNGDYVFQPHNIESIAFSYGEQNFFLKTPNAGMINNDTIEKKLFNDYLDAPPFGMTMNPDRVTLARISNGNKDTPYPHVYINFCNQGDKSRMIPFLSDATSLKDNLDLDLNFTFGPTGATNNMTYIIYLFYTDNNLTLDLSHKGMSYFTSPYIKLI